jgi:hypothetical protein
MALRNYPDKEVLSLIENAIATDTAVIPGEKTSSHYSKHRTKWGGKQQTLIIDILNKTKIEIKKKKMGNREDIPKAGSNNFTLSIQEHNILSTASDQSLGELYAPKIYLSTSDAWYGVDLYNADEGYFYTDYVPMYVNNVTRLDRKTANLNLAQAVTYQGTVYGPGDMPLWHLNNIGDTVFRSNENYLDFSPVWDDWFVSVEEGYRMLTVYPTVYFKVFRDPSHEDPTAIQYWFFSFYNKWMPTANHPGDWETITIFLDENEEPTQAIYSTHYEANKFSWGNIRVIDGSHPKVFVSNGGHGSYANPDETSYSGVYDYHRGDKEELVFSTNADCTNYGHYCLFDLSVEENKASNDSWILFQGRWGDEDSAPNGPHLRTDTPTLTDWYIARHPPYNVDAYCSKRYGDDKAYIYGIVDNTGPWHWALGYGLDDPWTSRHDCLLSNNLINLVPIYPLLLQGP